MKLRLPAQVSDTAINANFQEIERAATPEIYLPVLINGWMPQGSWLIPKVYRDGHGWVTIQGVFDGLTGPATAGGLMAIPWAPAAQVGGAVSYWTGAARALGTVIVNSTGGVTLLGNADVPVALDSFIVNFRFPAVSP